MPAAYSFDLRERVIRNIEDGVDRATIAKLFSIGTATIQRWWSRYKKTSNFSPKKDYQKGHSHKIVNLDKFQEFTEKNRSLTCEEMALRLENISPRTVNRYLNKIEFTRKKKNFYTVKE